MSILDAMERLAPPQDGVFTTSDLLAIQGSENLVSLARWTAALIRSGRLQRIRRGLYIWKNANPASVARRLAPDATLGFGSALAHHLLIGTVPSRHHRFTTAGREVELETREWKLSLHHIAPDLRFGTVKLPDGSLVTDPEKSAIDCLYFGQHGMPFSFDLEHDIDRSALRRDVFLDYVERYRNPRFRSYCRRWIDDV